MASEKSQRQQWAWVQSRSLQIGDGESHRFSKLLLLLFRSSSSCKASLLYYGGNYLQYLVCALRVLDISSAKIAMMKLLTFLSSIMQREIEIRYSWELRWHKSRWPWLLRWRERNSPGWIYSDMQEWDVVYSSLLSLVYSLSGLETLWSRRLIGLLLLLKCLLIRLQLLSFWYLGSRWYQRWPRQIQDQRQSFGLGLAGVYSSCTDSPSLQTSTNVSTLCQLFAMCLYRVDDQHGKIPGYCSQLRCSIDSCLDLRL